ncbi:LysR substrate-binding domain-containing protein [Nonomuraea sp. NPDC050556]|uniref:LysR substrate-binding domain-containing protein n=1 Tax=Nonomuraea sp. NPDC050556 TaxID=3364369 RepID=UPI0037B9997E
MLPFNVLQHFHPFWQTFRQRHPQWELHLRRAPFTDPYARLRDRHMDVLIARLPAEEPDLTVAPSLPFHTPRGQTIEGVSLASNR